MILESIRVQNFRSIKDATLHCGNLTMLVGANGAGKSSFLKALEVFTDVKCGVTDEDYHNGNKSDEVSLTATFADLGTGTCSQIMQ